MTGVVIQQSGGKSWWAVFMGGVAALALSQVVPAIQSAHRRRSDLRELIASASRVRAPNGRLLTAKQMSLIDFGVHSASLPVPFEARDVQPELARMLTCGRPSLLIGPPLCGKSRLAAEVLKQHMPSRKVLVPIPDQLPRLLGSALLKNHVVLLDSLESYLDVDGIHGGVVRDLHEMGNVVIATIRESDYASAIAHTHPEWRENLALFDRFTAIRVRDDDAEELDRLGGSFANDAHGELVRAYGIGAFASGSAFAARRMENSRSSHPLGVAIVEAAGHWQRLGFKDASKDRILELAAIARQSKAEQESADAAFTWAEERIHSVVQILETTAPDRYRVSGHVASYLERTTEIPEAVWDFAVNAAKSSKSLYRIGMAAYTCENHAVGARALSMVDTNSKFHARALAQLGFIEEDRGHVDHARRFFTEALQHTDQVPGLIGLSINLGKLEDQAGNTDAARRAFSRAATSADPHHGPGASMQLGLFEEGLLNAAHSMRAFREAYASRHPEYGGYSGMRLAEVSASDGNVDEALAILMDCAHFSSPTWRVESLRRWMAYNVAAARDREALAELAETSATGDEQLAVSVELVLAEYFWDRELFGRARSSFDNVFRSGVLPYDLMAVEGLACREFSAGLNDRALESLEVAVALISAKEPVRDWPSPDLRPHWVHAFEASAGHALRHLGQLAEMAGDVEAAEGAYAEASSIHYSNKAAALRLATLQSEGGRADEAIETLEALAYETEGSVAAQAGVELASLFRARGDYSSARQALLSSIAVGHPEHSAQAAYTLGCWEEDLGRREQAKDFFRQAVDFGDESWSKEATKALDRYPM